MDNTKEEWKDIIIDGEIYPYRISNFGRVYSIKSKIFLKHEITKKGYHRVMLYKNNIPIRKLVHRLVAIFFIENPENKPQVNHKDGNKSHNYESNLEWVTASENDFHAYRTNLKFGKRGQESHFAKADVETVKLACELMETGKYTIRNISKITKISEEMLYNIKNRKCWINVSYKYDVENCIISLNNYTEEQFEKVFKLLEEDKLSIYEISDLTEVSASTITNIYLGRNKKFSYLYDLYDVSKYHKNKILPPFSDEAINKIKDLIQNETKINDIIIIINEIYGYNRDRIRHYIHRIKKRTCSTTRES